MLKRFFFFMKGSGGVSGMMTALLIGIFVALLALVVDLGHLHGVRNELQNAADAAALAGARALVKMEDYPVVVAPDPPYCGMAYEKAREAILANKSDGASLQMDLGATLDVTLGRWEWGTNSPSFTPFINQYPGPDPVASPCTLDNINAVNVVVRRSDEGATAGPSVFTTFAKIFGWDSAPVVASSTAAVGYIRDNCTFFLLALLYNEDPNSWFQQFLKAQGFLTLNTGSDKDLTMDEGAWADPSNNSYTPAQYIKDFFKGRVTPDCTSSGGKVDLQGGVDADILHSIKDKLADLRATSRTANDQWNHECKGNNYEGWLMLAPLVKNDRLNQPSDIFDPDSRDPNGNPLGPFIPIVIKNVYNPNDKDAPKECQKQQGHCIELGYFPCEVQAQGPPGGSNSTILATRPKLVHFDWPWRSPGQ